MSTAAATGSNRIVQLVHLWNIRNKCPVYCCFFLKKEIINTCLIQEASCYTNVARVIMMHYWDCAEGPVTCMRFQQLWLYSNLTKLYITL